MSAGSERQALGIYFYERICHMFWISKCRGDWNLGLCTLWVLVKENHCAMSDSDFLCGRNTSFFGSHHCAVVLFSKVPKHCTYINLSLLCILILLIHVESSINHLRKYIKFSRKNNFLALGVCFPQPCSSAGSMFAASESRLHITDELFRFHNDEFDEMPCKLHSARIRVRSRNTQPHLNSLIRSWSHQSNNPSINHRIISSQNTLRGCLQNCCCRHVHIENEQIYERWYSVSGDRSVHSLMINSFSADRSVTFLLLSLPC